MKEWKCVSVGHHDNVGSTIQEMERAGWHLHTYTTAGSAGMATSFINHYLLFVKGE